MPPASLRHSDDILIIFTTPNKNKERPWKKMENHPDISRDHLTGTLAAAKIVACAFEQKFGPRNS